MILSPRDVEKRLGVSDGVPLALGEETVPRPPNKVAIFELALDLVLHIATGVLIEPELEVRDLGRQVMTCVLAILNDFHAEGLTCDGCLRVVQRTSECINISVSRVIGVHEQIVFVSFDALQLDILGLLAVLKQFAFAILAFFVRFC